ncbi:MAG: HEAT repeat domain-containing protein, partial [Bdellovibrionota bacterium]
LHAIRGLMRMKLKRATRHLRPMTADPSGGIRVNALQALTELSAKAAAPEFIRALLDEQWYVRKQAAVACGKLRIRSSYQVLQTLAKNDQKKAVREAAITSLTEISKLQTHSPSQSRVKKSFQ